MGEISYNCFMGNNKPSSYSVTSPYTPHYKESCFTAWYAAGRPPKASQIHDLIPEDEHGRKPNTQALSKWRNELYWDIRADELDAKANAIVDDKLVNTRVLMLNAQASRGKELQVQGMDWLREHGFDSSSSAVRAIFRGSELERTSRGISDRLISLLKLSDDKLIENIQKMIEEANESGEIVEAEILEENVKDS